MLTKTCLVLPAAALAGAAFASISFQGLGGTAVSGFRSSANSVSANGSVVVGAFNFGDSITAYRWTQATGMVALGDLPGGSAFSASTAVSHDGWFVVGAGSSANGFEAFMWSPSPPGMFGLGDLPGVGPFQSRAQAVSADGVYVSGFSQRPQQGHGYDAWRWSWTNGIQPIGDLPGGDAHGVPTDMNVNGSIIVGASSSSNGSEGFIWTQAAGMSGIGDLPGGFFSSSCTGISSSGQVVVGGSVSANGNEAFRWTQAGGMEPLGDLPGGGFSSGAVAVSGDGEIIVGSGDGGSGSEAFIWKRSIGMVSVRDFLFAHGVTAHLAWVNLQMNDISADGRTIVGTGTNPNLEWEAWVATIEFATTVAPETFTMQRGTAISGGLSELLSSDDARLVCRPAAVLTSVEHPIQLVVESHAPAGQYDSLRFRVEAHSNQPNINQTIALFNFASGTWLTLDSRTASTGDSSVEVTAPSVTQFVQPGTGVVRARVSYRANGPVLVYPWFARIDQTVWLFEE